MRIILCVMAIFLFLVGSAPSSNAQMTAPVGYRVRSLDPIDGKVLVPDGWHFASSIDPAGYTWIISQEPLIEGTKGFYKTGMRIQLIHGMHKYKKITPEEFIIKFIAGKKEDNARIIGNCSGVKLGPFQRKCLETKEDMALGGEKKKYRILYSMFWNNEIDTVIVMTFGTPVNKWDQDKKYLKNIGAITLPDFVKMYRNAKSRSNNGCLSGISNQETKKLYAYMEASGDGAKGLFTVAAPGNGDYPLDYKTFHPFSAEKFSKIIKVDHKYKRSDTIELMWPYSGAGKAVFLNKLHAALGNKVVGFKGAIWWYPDGSAVMTDSKAGLQWPDSLNIKTCIAKDGKILSENDCHRMVAGLDHRKAIFSNTMFAPRSCSELGHMSINALLGDAEEALNLYFYYAMVENNSQEAEKYLLLAVAHGNKLARVLGTQYLIDQHIKKN